MKITLFILVLSLLNISIYAQKGVIVIDKMYVNEDVGKKMVLINKNIKDLNSLYSGKKNSIKFANRQYTFTSPVLNFEYGKAYKVRDLNNKKLNLYFTSLPIINIVTKNSIVDKPKVYAQFYLCENNGNFIQGMIGIEYRGGTTQSFPKKSYSIEFWTEDTGKKTRDVRLLGLRSDDDWNLQAMYNEPLRIRSKANFELWRKIDTLHYSNMEAEAINGVRQEYVELFVNDKYKGIYTLSEKPDRKQFKLKKYKYPKIRGELYKGIHWNVSTFKTFSPYNNDSFFWNGLEYKYPKKEINWHNIYEFVNFFIHSDSADFYKNYQKKINVQNAINYFIFLNVLRASDNTGKNIFIAKYNIDEPYFYIPWDLDGTFGIIWNGKKENISNDILTNLFYDRLLKDSCFRKKLKQRWCELRKGPITVDSIIANFKLQFNYLKANGVYERELIAWKNSGFLDLKNLKYTENWLNKRLKYLDTIFNQIELLENKKKYQLVATNYYLKKYIFISIISLLTFLFIFLRIKNKK